MPWSVMEGHDGCPSGRPWAVVKDQDGTVEGCHPTRGAAEDQRSALNAAEADMDVSKLALDVASRVTAQEDCPPGQHRMPDGTCMDDSEMADDGTYRSWSGVIALEGVETGDGREFAPGSLEWAELPLPLLWQEQSEPGHNRSVVVGRIDRIERDGAEIRATGVIEADAKVTEQLDNGLAGGISVDVDSVKDADVELVFPDEDTSLDDGEDGIVALFGPPPEKAIFHRGRLRAATLVAIPAFVEARIQLDDADTDTDAVGVLASVASRAFDAVGPHDTGTTDDAWDAAANEARLPSPMPVATARNVYAWTADGATEDGQVRKTDLRFPHHMVSADGTPGAANLSACSAGIGILNGARGGTNIPAPDRQGVYNHLAAHLRDGGQEAPELLDAMDVITASGIPLYPPREWFTDPAFDGPTPWTVDDNGRVFGHLALWSVCHTTFPDRCITPPREGDFPYFQRSEVRTHDGQRVGVGPVTLGTGHAALRHGAVPAVRHYDDTGLAACDVAVGEDRYGIWVAGALRTTLGEERVRELRGAALSGDWRTVGGRLRLVAVLAVNVPGYPVPKMRAMADTTDWSALVAAGVVTSERAGSVREALASMGADGTIRVRRVRNAALASG